MSVHEVEPHNSILKNEKKAINNEPFEYKHMIIHNLLSQVSMSSGQRVSQ
jgi:hypothetical protein